MRVLVTGSQGFIGKNLVVRLGEVPGYEVICFDRGDALSSLAAKVAQADAVVHLAGENRPKDAVDFETGNAALTRVLCDAIQESGRKLPLGMDLTTHRVPYSFARPQLYVCRRQQYGMGHSIRRE